MDLYNKTSSPIRDFVNEKINQLKWFDGKLRWEGGRLYYESTTIINEISKYPLEVQISILELLHEEIIKNKIVIQDRWPHSNPVITDKFLNWLRTRISKMKIRFDDLPKMKVILGFICNLPKETLLEIFLLMTGKLSNKDERYLECSKKQFMNVFNRERSTIVIRPLKWLLFSRGGIKSGRGNQTALYVFLEMMLGTLSNADLVKSKDLFIDNNGSFIDKSLLRPDINKINIYGFEDPLNDILKKS